MFGLDDLDLCMFDDLHGLFDGVSGVKVGCNLLSCGGTWVDASSNRGRWIIFVGEDLLVVVESPATNEYSYW